MDNPKTFIVCALDCEARPLIRHFGLKPEKEGGGFRVYRKESLRLVVTGVGREKAGAGTAFLGEGLKGKSPAIWLNIGIAGHPTRTIGEAVIAGKISNGETGKSWYPHLAFRPVLPVDWLISVRKPAGFDGEKALFDMEAAGFYPAALRYSTSGLVHCIKLVSDNRENPPAEIRPARVRDWVGRALPKIEETLRRLAGLVEKRTPPAMDRNLLEEVLSRWHFSEYQRLELEGVFRRLDTLRPEGVVRVKEIPDGLNSKDLLAYFKAHLEGYLSAPGVKRT